MKSQSLINNFLTSGITLAAPKTIRRIKVLNIFELVFVVMAPFLGLFYFYVGAFFLFYITVIAGLLGIVVILLLRMTKKPRLISNFAVFVLWAVLIIIRWNTGGMSAEGLILLFWVWNAVLILLAIFLTGYLWGTIWACLMFMESGLTVFLFRSGHNFTNLIPPEISPVYSLGSYLIGLLVILLFGFLFEKERDDYQMREEEKSKMLRAFRTYIEDILERLPVPTFVLDNNHRVIQWNRACQELTDITPQQIIGKRVWEGFSMDMDKEGSLADILLDSPEALSKKYHGSIVSKTGSGSFAIETFLPRLKGGLRAIINTAPIVDQKGRIKGAIQTIQDISMRKEGSETGSGFMHDNIENAAFPVFKVDSKGKISAWNKACEENFGYSLSQMFGNSPLLLVSNQYRHEFLDTTVRVFKGESFGGKEWEYYTSKGEPIYILAKVYPVHDRSGEVRECVVVSTDITDLKMRLKKSERYAAEIRERLKKLGEEYNLLKSNIASFLRQRNDQSR